MPCGFRTRKRGTARQIGTKFPVLQKKKLPPRISLPSHKNKISGVTAVTYEPPFEGKEGSISFFFSGDMISNTIKVVDKNSRVGQFDVLQPVVYVSSDVPAKWLRYLAIHESLEAQFVKKYKIDENSAHTLAEEIELREFLKSHPIHEWKRYEATCKFVHKLDGGKVSKKVELERAFALLAQSKRS